MKLNYGEALKQQRKMNGFTQEQLSKSTGIVQPNISAWENNIYTPNIDFCVILADFYGITVDELIGRDETSSTLTKKERAAGARNTKTEHVTPIEDDMLYAFRQLKQKHGEEAQRAVITMIEKML